MSSKTAKNNNTKYYQFTNHKPSKHKHTLGKTQYRRSLCLIYGFTRDAQHTLFPHNIIPNDITQMCFRFYFSNPIIFLSSNKPKHKFYRIYFFSSKLNCIQNQIYIKFLKDSQTSYQMCQAVDNNKHLLYLDVCIPKKWLSNLSISFHHYIGKDIMNIITIYSPKKLDPEKTRAIFYRTIKNPDLKKAEK
eukprot:200066_1